MENNVSENIFRNIGEPEGLPELSHEIVAVWKCKREDPLGMSWIVWKDWYMHEHWDFQYTHFYN